MTEYQVESYDVAVIGAGHAGIEAALAAGASRSFVSGSGPSVIAFVPDDAVARRVRTAWEQSATVDRIIAAQAPARPVITVLPSLSYRVRQ